MPRFGGSAGLDEVLAGPGDAGADGADAYAGDLRGLLVGVAQDLGEDEGFAAFLGKKKPNWIV